MNREKNKKKRIINTIFILVWVGIIIWIFCLAMNKSYKFRNMVYSIEEKLNEITLKDKAVVVWVGEESLYCYKNDSLHYAKFDKRGDIGFTQGQEILIYHKYNPKGWHTSLWTYPIPISNVTKIEITKEESDIDIPEKVLRHFYSSRNKISIAVENITKDRITIAITDGNEFTYEYPNYYTISKLVKNEEYTGKGQKIGKDTENSISGFTRNRFSNKMGKPKRYLKWKK